MPSLLILLHGLFKVLSHGLFLQLLLLGLLLLQQSLFLSALLLTSLLSSCLHLLPLDLIFLELLGVTLSLSKLRLQTLECLNHLLFYVLFELFLEHFPNFVLLHRLYIVNYHVVEVIAQYLPDLITAIRVVL